MDNTVYSENKRARLDYEILDTLTGGLELLGHEVKSIRAGRGNLSGSYVLLRGEEAWLVNSDVPPYQVNNTPQGYDQNRNRRVLLRKEEIRFLEGKLKGEKLFLVPLKILALGRNIKLILGLGRSKKKQDKREDLKTKTHKREMREGR